MRRCVFRHRPPHPTASFFSQTSFSFSSYQPLLPPPHSGLSSRRAVAASRLRPITAATCCASRCSFLPALPVPRPPVVSLASSPGLPSPSHLHRLLLSPTTASAFCLGLLPSPLCASRCHFFFFFSSISNASYSHPRLSSSSCVTSLPFASPFPPARDASRCTICCPPSSPPSPSRSRPLPPSSSFFFSAPASHSLLTCPYSSSSFFSFPFISTSLLLRSTFFPFSASLLPALPLIFFFLPPSPLPHATAHSSASSTLLPPSPYSTFCQAAAHLLPKASPNSATPTQLV